jgi:hypothetical protein
VGVHVIDVTRTGVLVDARIIEYRRIIDLFLLDARGHDSCRRIVTVNRPRYRHRFRTAGNAAAGAPGCENRVSHAPSVAIENDVFDRADLFPRRAFHGRPDNLARFDVAAATRRARAGLGLSIYRSNGQTQNGQNCHGEE